MKNESVLWFDKKDFLKKFNENPEDLCVLYPGNLKETLLFNNDENIIVDNRTGTRIRKFSIDS